MSQRPVRVLEETSPSHFSPSPTTKRSFLQAAKEFCGRHKPLTAALQTAALFGFVGIWGGPHLFEIGGSLAIGVYVSTKIQQKFGKDSFFAMLSMITAGAIVAPIIYPSHKARNEARDAVEEQVQARIAAGTTTQQYAEKSYMQTPFWGWYDVKETARYGMRVLDREAGVLKIEVDRDGDKRTGFFVIRPKLMQKKNATPLVELY